MNDLGTLTEYLTDALTGMLSYLPTLALGLVVLLIGWGIARLVARSIRRLLERVDLETILERAGLLSGLEKAGFSQSPAELVGSFIFWIIFLNVLLIALETLGLTALVEPLRNFIAFLPSVLVAGITLIIGALAAQFVGRAVQGALAGMGVELYETLGNLVRLVMMVVVLIIVLQQLGMDVTLLNDTFITLLTLAFAGMSLAFALGGRHLARAVLAGYYARESFRPGDRVIIDGFEGTIESIGTLNTAIKGEETALVVPNTRLTEENVEFRP